MPSLAFLFKNRGTVTLQEQRMERRKREKRDWRDKKNAEDLMRGITRLILNCLLSLIIKSA